jgi:hypothetical protein
VVVSGKLAIRNIVQMVAKAGLAAQPYAFQRYRYPLVRQRDDERPSLLVWAVVVLRGAASAVYSRGCKINLMSASVSQLIFDQAEETPRAEHLVVLIWVAHVPDGSDEAGNGVETFGSPAGVEHRLVREVRRLTV